MKSVLLPFVLFFCWTTLLGREADFYMEMEKIRSRLKEGKDKAALSAAKGLAERRDLPAGLLALAKLQYARMVRESGDEKKALDILKGIVNERPGGYWLELGECLVSSADFEGAFKALQNEIFQESGIDFFRSTFVLARAEFGLKKYLDCMRECERIMREPLPGFAKVDAPVDSDARQPTVMVEEPADTTSEEEMKKFREALMSLKEKAKELHRHARGEYEIERYGKDYYWYRLGREAEFEGDLKGAVGNYDKVSGGTLKRAADCYAGHCLAELGETDKALKRYRTLIDGPPGGTYRAEAILHASMLLYRTAQGRSSVQSALEMAERMDGWRAAVRLQTGSGITEIEGVNDALRDDVIRKMESRFLRHDDCGNLFRTNQEPGSIINRATAPWYLPWLEIRSHLLRGFLLSELGRKEESVRQYVRADSGGGFRILRRADTLPSLKTAVMEGGCLVSAKGWEKLGNRRGYQVRLGLFLIMSEEEDAGERLLDAYLADRDVSGAQERACALLGKAYCLIIADKREEAGKRLSALRTGSRYRSTDEGKIAAYLQGCMLSQDKQSMKDAVTIFGDLANDKNFSLAPKALLALAQAQANGGDWKGAMQSADALRKKFGKTVYGDAGSTLHAAVRTIKENDKGIGPLESGSGDVVLHRRTVVVPSSSVWELYSDKFRPGDWVLYDLTFVSRDPCSVIRGIQVGLEPMEPQPQRAKGNRLVFVRSPLLHMSGLRQLDPRSPEARGRGADGEDSATQ